MRGEFPRWAWWTVAGLAVGLPLFMIAWLAFEGADDDTPVQPTFTPTDDDLRVRGEEQATLRAARAKRVR